MTYNVKCPLCGTENKNLYLDETNGWFECERCKREVLPLKYAKTKSIPLYDYKAFAKAIQTK